MIGSGIVEGIGSAVAFGAGDFSGGRASSHVGGMVAAAGSQLVGALGMLVLLLVVRPPVPSAGPLLIAAAAGLFGVVGVAALYRGLSMGSMGLVAAISAIGSLVLPLVVSVVAYRAHIGIGPLLGVACAGAAGAAAAGAARDSATRSALLLAAGASVAFGMWYVLLDLAAQADPLWALTTTRFSASAFMGAVVLVFARGRGGRGLGAAWPLLVVAGVLDATGNGLFVLSSADIAVGLAAALSGMYPLVTMLLAGLILHQGLPRLGYAAVGLAVVGIILISVG